MKVLATLLLSLALLAQERRQFGTVTYDLNGRRVEQPQGSYTQVPGGAVSTLSTRSINGAAVLIERVEERVVREDANGKVVERIVRRFDNNGTPAGVERTQIEERTHWDGSRTATTTLYRSDLNGRLNVIERSVAETRKLGDVENTQAKVERVGVGGFLELVELVDATARATATGSEKDVRIRRRDSNGRFYDMERVSSTTTTGPDGQVQRTTARYEGGTFTPSQLVEQSVAKQVKNPDGSSVEEVSVYGVGQPGRAAAQGGKLLLREQHLIERRQQGDVTTEILSVRRPSLSDSNRMGNYEKYAERTCKGACTP